MSPRAGTAGPHTLAFVESPVQLLNVLEWAHAHSLGTPEDPGAGPFRQAVRDSPSWSCRPTTR